MINLIRMLFTLHVVAYNPVAYGQYNKWIV